MRAVSLGLWVVVWWRLAALALGAEAQYVGSEACAACHTAESTAQARSAHAGALRPAAQHPLAEAFAQSARARDGAWLYEVATQDGGALEMQLRRGEQLYRQPLEWAFGSGYQAVTFVSQLSEDEYLEHHLSYYPRLKRYGITPGHHGEPTGTPEQALGVRYRTFSERSEVMRCFRCHSTGPLGLSDVFGIKPAELGVRCEACHGPGSEHIALIGAGEFPAARTAVANPSRLDAGELMEYCGSCHRPPASDGEAIDWGDPWNVRHQPIYLSRSACFVKSSGGLKCMNCHDPHSPIRRDDPAYYNARCAGCHTAAENAPAAVCDARIGCASCHMPGVEPQTELTFHNHWIGIYGTPDPLLPVGAMPASDWRTSLTNGSSGP